MRRIHRIPVAQRGAQRFGVAGPRGLAVRHLTASASATAGAGSCSALSAAEATSAGAAEPAFLFPMQRVALRHGARPCRQPTTGARRPLRSSARCLSIACAARVAEAYERDGFAVLNNFATPAECNNMMVALPAPASLCL